MQKRDGLAACAVLLFVVVAVSLSSPLTVPANALSQNAAKSQNKPASKNRLSENTKATISASAVKGIPPGTPPESPEELLEAEQIARRVPEKAKEGILVSIEASNLPTADDLQGGFHEESGVGGESAFGSWVNSPGKPGPYFNPAIDHVATMEEIPADQNLRDEIASPEVFWHIHPAGIVKAGSLIYFWEQAPSDLDRAAAAPGAINIVVGARDGTVYIYDREGPVLTISLQEFLKGAA